MARGDEMKQLNIGPQASCWADGKFTKRHLWRGRDHCERCGAKWPAKAVTGLPTLPMFAAESGRGADEDSAR